MQALASDGEYSLTLQLAIVRSQSAVRILDGDGAAGREHRVGIPTDLAVAAKRPNCHAAFRAGHGDIARGQETEFPGAACAPGGGRSAFTPVGGDGAGATDDQVTGGRGYFAQSAFSGV